MANYKTVETKNDVEVQPAETKEAVIENLIPKMKQLMKTKLVIECDISYQHYIQDFVKFIEERGIVVSQVTKTKEEYSESEKDELFNAVFMKGVTGQ